MPTDNGANQPWEIPDYLNNLYALWTALGNINDMLRYCHHVTHKVAEGYSFEGDTFPPDTIVSALLDAPIDEVEAAKDDVGRVISTHDLLVTAGAALSLAIKAIVYKLKAMDALPPWWEEGHEDGRPVLEFLPPDE